MIRRIVFLATTLYTMFFSYVGVVSAAECAWLPSFLCNLVANDNPVTVIEARIRAAFFIAIGVIILVAIAYGLYNAYKYIKSGGGEGMEDANKGMRAILFGIGSIFVILLGIAAVLLFFGANFLQVWLAPSCIAKPDGAGCYACQNQTDDNNKTICKECNTNPRSNISVDLSPRSGNSVNKVDNGQIITNGVNSGYACSGEIQEVKN